MRALLALGLWLGACGTPDPQGSSSTATDEARPRAASAEEPGAGAGAPDEAAPEGAAAGPEEAPPMACSSDGDCHFDDACVPRSCQAQRPEQIPCEESAPPPGRCLCLGGRCALRRDAMAFSEDSCQLAGDCGFVRAVGLCEAGHPDERPPDLGAGLSQPTCRCQMHEGERRCGVDWSEPVPCSSDRDCWWGDRNGHRVPIQRPRRLRGRAFRPCVDGEVAPECIEGFCGANPLGVYGC